MTLTTRGKSLIGAVLALGIVGVAVSACAPGGPEGGYANGYYDYSSYYDPGYFNEFRFVDPDRNHDGRHRHDRDGDHDGGDRYGIQGGGYMRGGMGGTTISRGPAVVTSPSLAPRSAIGDGHSFGGERGGGERGGGRR
jgi:hypothetical protein